MARGICFFIAYGVAAAILVDGALIEVVTADDAEETCPILDTQVTKIVECVRRELRKGIPSFGIDTLDPLEFRILPLPFNNDYLRGVMVLTNFKLEGITGFVLTKGNVTVTSQVQLAMNFDKIQVTTGYRGRLTLFGIIDLYGRGTLSLTFNNLNLDSDMRFKILPLPLQVRELNLQIMLPTIKADITGLLNDEYMSGLITRQLDDTLAALVEQEQQNFDGTVNTAVSYLVESVINPLLEGLTIQDIIRIINVYLDNCASIFTILVETLTNEVVTRFPSDFVFLDYDLLNSDYDNDLGVD